MWYTSFSNLKKSLGITALIRVKAFVQKLNFASIAKLCLFIRFLKKNINILTL